MSDNPTRITYNGRTYRATPEALAQLQQRGITYEVAPAPESDTSLADIAGGAARGALHGISFGLADAQIPGVGKSATELVGLQPYEDVQKETPIASAVGDLASGFTIPGGALLKVAGKLGAAPKVIEFLLGHGKGLAGAAGAVAGGALDAAGQGAIRGAFEGSDIGNSAALSAVLGAGGTALARSAAGISNAVKTGLESASDKTLARSVGLKGRELKGLAGSNPDVTVKEIANAVRETSPSTITNPKSAGERSVELKAALDTRYGPLVDQLIAQSNIPDAAARSGYSRVLQQLLGEVERAPEDTAPAKLYKSHLKRNIEGMAQNEIDNAQQFRPLKTAYNKAAYTNGLFINDSAAAQAAGTQAGAMDAGLDYLVQQHATPDVRRAFHANNAEYAKRARIQHMAEAQGKIEGSDSQLPELANALAGAAFGGLTAGGPMGAVEGLAGAGVMGATRSGLLKSLQSTRGLDRLSNIAAAGSRGAGAVSNAIEHMDSFSNAGRRVLVSTLLE